MLQIKCVWRGAGGVGYRGHWRLKLRVSLWVCVAVLRFTGDNARVTRKRPAMSNKKSWTAVDLGGGLCLKVAFTSGKFRSVRQGQGYTRANNMLSTSPLIR